MDVGLGASLTMACMACLLVGALILQFRARRYVPWIYWLTVVLVSIVGTQITDLLNRQVGDKPLRQHDLDRKVLEHDPVPKGRAQSA